MSAIQQVSAPANKLKPSKVIKTATLVLELIRDYVQPSAMMNSLVSNGKNLTTLHFDGSEFKLHAVTDINAGQTTIYRLLSLKDVLFEFEVDPQKHNNLDLASLLSRRIKPHLGLN